MLQVLKNQSAAWGKSSWYFAAILTTLSYALGIGFGYLLTLAGYPCMCPATGLALIGATLLVFWQRAPYGALILAVWIGVLIFADVIMDVPTTGSGILLSVLGIVLPFYMIARLVDERLRAKNPAARGDQGQAA